MKKLLLFAALVLGVVSCMKDQTFDANVGGETDVVLSVALPSDGTRTNLADSATGALGNIDLTDDYDIRYILEVYDAHETLAKRIVKTEDVKPSTTFELRLIPGRAYTFVVWADFVAQGTEADNHYITSGEFGLRNVSLNNASEHKAMDESRDAYTGIQTVSNFNSSSVIAFELKRPFAKLRVVTNDMNQIYSSLVSGEVEYNVQDVYTAFNALTEAPVAASAGSINVKSFPYDETTAYATNRENEKTLFADYLFGTASTTVQFALTVTDSVEELPTVYFNTAIPVQRNYLTTIYGPILTDYNNVTVTINPAFENDGNFEGAPYYQVAVTNGVELIKALMQGREIIVLNDITVTAADLAEATRAGEVAINPVLNLNGCTVTFVNDTDEPLITVAEGSSLTIVDEKGTGAIVVTGTGVAIENNGTINIEGGKLNDGAIVNNGEANISGGELNEGAIENNGTTNVTDGKINEGAITDTENGTTSITGGEFTYTPDADEVTEGFEVKTDENGNYVVVESDPVAKIGEVEYTTLKAAFEAVENGQTIKLLSNVTTRSTAVLAEGKTATLNLNYKTLSGTMHKSVGHVVENKGTLTIKNGTISSTANNGGSAVMNTGELEINNVTLNGAPNADGSWPSYAVNNAGTLEMQKATITSYHGGIASYGEDAIVTLEDCTLDMTGIPGFTSHGMYTYNSGVIVVNGGTYTNKATDQSSTGASVINGAVTVYGGTFSGRLENYSGTPVLYGGKYSVNPNAKFIANGYKAKAIAENTYVVIEDKIFAKVGNTEYDFIDDAIAAWTNNTTLTLLSDVTLSDVVTLKSTEHHTLNLGTYTLTAAKGKNAIEITCNGLSNATYALTINADVTNPGGITATGKSCIYYKKSDSTKDRPIILINNGVFTGSYSINSTSNGNTNCPQIWINGGVFNSYMNLTKNMLKVSGGTFHGAINCTGDSSAYRQISGGRFKSWQFMTADAPSKFWVGTARETYDVGVYVDDEGYLVVGGPVITEFGDKFAAKATNPTKWSSYLKYSSAAEHGLYYTNADAAIAKHGEANVVLK